MLHKPKYEIMGQYLGDYTKEVYGRQLIGKVTLSHKGIALALEELQDQSILKSHSLGNRKLYGLNFMNKEIKDILCITEIIKKILFFQKERKIAYLFNQDKRIVGIFGSYACGTDKKESDIDIFIVGEKKKDDYEKKSDVLGLQVSIKYFSEKEMKKLLLKKNNLWKEIVKNHILIFGAEQFISLLWGNYYGLS